ncbi:MAG: single-stranded DNA-binding protein [Bacteroidota bacterium]
MNSLRNNIVLIGHLGKDPELKKLGNGRTMATISLATNEYYKKNGERVSVTQWHRCIAWGNLADLMSGMLNKGKEIVVRGKLTYNIYQDRQGIRRNVPQIVVNEFVLLNKRDR